MRAGAIVGILALAALAALPARAESRSHLSDAQVQSVIEHALLDRGIVGVRVTTDHGAVTLTGMVSSAWNRDEAGWLAQKARDVTSVDNQLTIARGESDADVAEQVATRLRRYVLYSVFDDVNMSVQDGKVTLTGEVTAGYKAKDMARIASQVTGVQEVHNAIRTLPASTFDEQIRAAVASHIYSDPIFEAYALQADPPIHIVVENGRVTLTGAVGNQMERIKAAFDARDVFGVMDVKNELRVAS